MAVETKPADLQYLGVVPEYLSKGAQVAESVYATLKSYTPSSIAPRVEAVESRVAETATPWVTAAQDKGTAILKVADDKLSGAVGVASSYYSKNTTYLQETVEKQKQFHAQNLANYKAAKESLFKKIEETIDFLKEKGLAGAAHTAAEQVKKLVAEARSLPSHLPEQAKAVTKQLQDAWKSFTELPSVQRTLGTVNGSVDFAWQKYLTAHDAVVANPTYEKAYGTVGQYIKQIEGTSLYQTASQKLYPVVAPVADPALEVATPYYNAVVDHWKPSAAVAKAS